MTVKVSRYIPSNRYSHRGDLTHVDHIPGGKRFWKVGQLYRVVRNGSWVLFDRKYELVEAAKWLHRKTNQRLDDAPASHTGLLEKHSLFILLRPPSYVSIVNGFHPMNEAYQINVLNNEKVGWLTLYANRSPREYCVPVRVSE